MREEWGREGKLNHRVKKKKDGKYQIEVERKGERLENKRLIKESEENRGMKEKKEI